MPRLRVASGVARDNELRRLIQGLRPRAIGRQGITGGFTFGNFEDTPRIALFDQILRHTGYILSRRKQGQSFQSNYINSELMREVISRNQVTTIF